MNVERHDLLVIGGGPAGAATAHWAARHDLDVVVVERATYPRQKTCGDGLTPRAVGQLHEMGLRRELERFHRHEGLRAVAHGKAVEMPWPEHPDHPDHGFVVRRPELDRIVAENALVAGAAIREGIEAVEPIVDRGLVVGATLRDTASRERSELYARYLVIADGASSPFGRTLGTWRDRSYPEGMAIRSYYYSPMHDTPWIESVLDVRDREGSPLPGYGWIFPLGDGTVNVGVGLLSTFREFKRINPNRLLGDFAAALPDYWEVDPAEPVAAPVGGRLPMGGSVGPKVGPNFLVVGDAAGSINPFNGDGIDYAFETGRMAAGLVAEAIDTGDGLALRQYPTLLDETYGLYFKVARVFAKAIGNPRLLRELTRAGMQSHTLMEWALRIMANLLRDDELGPAEAAYKAMATIARFVPDADAAA